tara:strand:- start:2608 stop:3750 length:1143 start_codon:yes stop_codon:yes gene_type:complete
MHINNINKNLIAQYFPNKSIPTALHFEHLIRGLINTHNSRSLGTDSGSITDLPDGTYDIGPNVIRSVLSLSSGSEDYFHKSAPPFVPHLHPYIKVLNWDSYMQMTSGSLKPAGEKHTDFIWDCTRGQNSSQGTGNVFNIAASGSISSSYVGNTTGMGDTGRDMVGYTTIKTDDDNGDYISLGTSVAPFQCGKYPWWIKTRFKTPDTANASNIEFFFGLTEHSRVAKLTDVFGAIGSGADRIGFIKQYHNDSKIEFCVSKNSTGVESNVTNNLDPTMSFGGDVAGYVHNMGIHWDAHANPPALKYYYSRAIRDTGSPNPAMQLVHTFTSGSVSGDISGPVPDDSHMRLVFYVGTGEAASKQVLIEHICSAYHTNDVNGSYY